jgi:serine-type D-Ala-D-Ala carboxypeptidase (penicillin-binding protein 5/6)
VRVFERLRGAIQIVLLLASVACASAAKSYIVIDNQTGLILASTNANEKLQVGSLTKIATAMVAFDWAQLNKADLSQMATVSARALQAGGINPAGLQEGDSLSLRDLLYTALMASDNVAATALAQYVGARLPNAEGLEPVGNFVSHMNALARALGMKRTLFLNPSGSDNVEGALPYSTASDMARLTRYAYSEADFPFFVSQKTRIIHVFRGGVDTPIELRNTNELLDKEGIDGVKTGRTRRAGDCLILSAERKPEVQRNGETVFVTPRRIVVVLLGSQDRFGEGMALTRQGWGLYDQWAAQGRKIEKNEAL